MKATPLGTSSSEFVDAAGRGIRSIDPRGRVTKYEYDALNQVTKLTDHAGRRFARHAPDARVGVRTTSDQQWAAGRELRRRVSEALREAGVIDLAASGRIYVPRTAANRGAAGAAGAAGATP